MAPACNLEPMQVFFSLSKHLIALSLCPNVSSHDHLTESVGQCLLKLPNLSFSVFGASEVFLLTNQTNVFLTGNILIFFAFKIIQTRVPDRKHFWAYQIFFFLWFSFSTLISEHVKEDFPGPKTFLGVSRNSSIDLHSNSRRNTAWIEQIPDRNKSPDGNKINTLSTVRLLTGPVFSLMSEHDCERDCKQTNKINGRLNETLANGS